MLLTPRVWVTHNAGAAGRVDAGASTARLGSLHSAPWESPLSPMETSTHLSDEVLDTTWRHMHVLHKHPLSIRNGVEFTPSPSIVAPSLERSGRSLFHEDRVNSRHLHEYQVNPYPLLWKGVWVCLHEDRANPRLLQWIHIISMKIG